MAALSAVAPVLNKAPAVSTGKAANTNSMMVWQPHGNKCVRFPASPRSPARPRFFPAPRACAISAGDARPGGADLDDRRPNAR